MTSAHPLIEILHYVSEGFQGLSTSNLGELILNAPQLYSHWWISLYHSSPNHVIVETGLILFILWLWFIRPTINPEKASRNTVKLTKQEVDELVEEWQPEPLVQPLSDDEQALANSMKVIESYDGFYVHVRGYANKALNLAAFDFLGMSQYPALKEDSEKALLKYGCGSCGPRGFYGTIDIHLKLEEQMTKFMGTEEAISYSDGPCTVSSAIPAFAKKGDVLLVDECVHEAVRTGINLSRSTVRLFRHNDMAHLESIMKEIERNDNRKHRAKEEQRRFIVVEGLYRNKGTVCPLPQLMALKRKYCYRLILDESYSFGAIGATGRGVTEHFGVPRSDVEILLLSMENALGTVGGVCVGSRAVVDHQRLSGAAYCFSASAPPFLSAAALAGLQRLDSNGAVLLRQLQENTARFIAGVKALKDVKVVSEDSSPIVLFAPRDMNGITIMELSAIMAFAEECLRRGLLLAVSRFDGGDIRPVEETALTPSLRACMNAELTPRQIDDAVTVIKEARAALQI